MNKHFVRKLSIHPLLNRNIFHLNVFESKKISSIIKKSSIQVDESDNTLQDFDRIHRPGYNCLSFF
jgi:hypothetical protein